VLAKKILRDEGHEYVKTHMTGIARGMILLVGFFSRGILNPGKIFPA
jgi:hypothetical protein